MSSATALISKSFKLLGAGKISINEVYDSE